MASCISFYVHASSLVLVLHYSIDHIDYVYVVYMIYDYRH